MTEPDLTEPSLSSLPPAQVEDDTGLDPAEMVGEFVDDDLDPDDEVA